MKIPFVMICFLWLISLKTNGQTYTVNFANEAYQPLVNDTTVSDSGWVGKLYPLNMPFPVLISNVSVSQIFVDTDGRIMRRTGQGTSASYRTLIYGYGNCGLRQLASDTSTISYLISGESPERIVKIQFRNAGFVGDETHTDKVNFQVWLYESGKRYEIRFGPNEMVPLRALNGAYGPFLGIGSQYLRGVPNTPSLGTLDYGLNGHPENGYVYRFTRP